MVFSSYVKFPLLHPKFLSLILFLSPKEISNDQIVEIRKFEIRIKTNYTKHNIKIDLHIFGGKIQLHQWLASLNLLYVGVSDDQCPSIHPSIVFHLSDIK